MSRSNRIYLIEQNIFDDKDLATIKVPEGSRDFFVKAMDYLKKNDTALIQGYSKWGDALKKSFQNSVLQYGYDTRTNLFLHFVKVAQNIDAIRKMGNDKYPALEMIRTLIANKELILTNQNLNNQSISKSPSRTGHKTTSNYNGWLFDPNTYVAASPGDLMYKIKALAFLSTGEAAAYGDTKTRPFDQIIAARKKSEIQQILTNWQTKPGEDQRRYRSGVSRNKHTGKVNIKGKVPETEEEKEAAKKVVERNSDTLKEFKRKISGASDEELAELLNRLYRVNDTDDTLIDKVVDSILLSIKKK